MHLIIEREFIQIVKDQLAERDWSLSELSRRTGITVANISLYLSGKNSPRFDQVERILAAFDLIPHLSVIESDKNLVAHA